MSPRVLVVDDELPLVETLTYALEREGFEVAVARDGEQAVEAALSQAFDLVLLDLMLPKLSGTEACRQIRARSAVPIIMLTARDSALDLIVGLEAGADDYVTKPFGPDELSARLRAVLRRSAEPDEGPVVEAGDLKVDLAAHRVTRDGQEIHLTPIEFSLVATLARHLGKLVTHRQLLNEVWGPQYGSETHYLRVHVAHIRAKIEPDPQRPRYLVTDPGVGYRLREPAP
jgi:DNA-binding response OmpR family regulator